MNPKLLTDRERKIVRIAFMETDPKFAHLFKPIQRGWIFACFGLVVLGLVAILDFVIRLFFERIFNPTGRRDR